LGLERQHARHVLHCAAIVRAAIVVFVTLFPPTIAHADAVDVINQLRLEGCANEPAAGAALQRDTRLDLVARELARDYDIEQAIARAAYPAEIASTLHFRGPRDDRALRTSIRDGYCRSVNNPLYDQVGVFTRREHTWVVLALRETERPALEPRAVANRVLQLINGVRAEGRTCGTDKFGAASSLTLSSVLNDAATDHAWDMAARGLATHEGADGSDSGERIARAGYLWQAAAENIAAGQRDADSAVQAWLDSPGHCATLMAPYFTETGIAYAESPSKNPPIYWVQVFATPRDSQPAHLQTRP